MDTIMSGEHLGDLDRWIEKLNDCKPLTEGEVKALCDMVSRFSIFCRRPSPILLW